MRRNAAYLNIRGTNPETKNKPTQKTKPNKKMKNQIDIYTNTNGIEYYSTKDENGDTIYSFTKEFEDIWSQEDQDLEDSRNATE
jgi:hypothetical protein